VIFFSLTLAVAHNFVSNLKDQYLD